MIVEVAGFAHITRKGIPELRVPALGCMSAIWTKIRLIYFVKITILVGENSSDLTKWRLTVFKYCRLMSHVIFTMFKRWYLMC